MATSAGALQQMLPVAAASMLEPHHFQLVSSMDRYLTAPNKACTALMIKQELSKRTSCMLHNALLSPCTASSLLSHHACQSLQAAHLPATSNPDWDCSTRWLQSRDAEASFVCRFETLVREVLLGQIFPGIFFGHSVMRFINDQFMAHDFTTAVLRKGLQVSPDLRRHCLYPSHIGTACTVAT